MVRSLVTLGRSSAFVVSVALHAAAIASGGHAAAARVENAASVDSTSLIIVDVGIEPAEVVSSPEEPMHPARAASPHRHAYPVAPSHDAREHDPSIVHLPLAPTADERASADAPLRFTLPAGSIVVGGAHVDAGTGAQSLPGSGGDVAAVMYDASQVNVPARLLAGAPVEYPPEARAAQIEADLALELVVDASGRVVRARSLSERGYGLDRAAVEAVRAYRFSPASRQGRAVAVRMRWTVQFRLR
jgi:protein TonB